MKAERSWPSRTIGDDAGYDGIMDQIVWDGGRQRIGVDDFIRANPQLSEKEVDKLIAKMPDASSRSGKYASISRFGAAAASAGISAQEFGESLRRFTETSHQKPWTSEDALQLILREIEKSDDPLKAGGEWLTRFTNGVTDITRKVEQDE